MMMMMMMVVAMMVMVRAMMMMMMMISIVWKGGAPDYQLVYFFWEKGKVLIQTKRRKNIFSLQKVKTTTFLTDKIGEFFLQLINNQVQESSITFCSSCFKQRY